MRMRKPCRKKSLEFALGIAFLAALFCSAGHAVNSSALVKSPAAARPDYRATLPAGWDKDNYILTQRFLALFDHTNMDAIQQIAQRGQQDMPDDFPLFMAVVLSLVKEPDSRLFWLLSPLAEQAREPDKPADLQEAMLRARILTGLDSVGNFAFQSGGPPYLYSFAFVPLQKEQMTLFGSELFWERLWPDGSSCRIRAVSATNGNTGVWGAVTDTPRQHQLRYNADVFSTADFFIVQEGIIKFASTLETDAMDFYGRDAKHIKIQILESDYIHTLLAKGAAEGRCVMRRHYKFDWNRQPPLLTAYLEQTEQPEDTLIAVDQPVPRYVCQAQCVLVYVWDDENYTLERKYCREGDDWGIWPPASGQAEKSGAQPPWQVQSDFFSE